MIIQFRIVPTRFAMPDDYKIATIHSLNFCDFNDCYEINVIVSVF